MQVALLCLVFLFSQVLGVFITYLLIELYSVS